MQAQPQPSMDVDTNMVDLTEFGIGPADSNDAVDLTGGMADADAMNNISTNANAINDNSNKLGDNGNNTADMSSVDADIEALLHSAGSNSDDKMEMDYELGGIGLDNNNFDEMFYENDDGGNEDFGQDSFYGI